MPSMRRYARHNAPQQLARRDISSASFHAGIPTDYCDNVKRNQHAMRVSLQAFVHPEGMP
jgi:hypothetical protein